MRELIKLFIASLLTAALSVATVLCCCSASAVMAHFHKAAICSHCSSPNSHGNSSDQAGMCQHQFQSAEFSHSQTFSLPTASAASFQASVFFDKHITTLPPSLSLAYPLGSPPSGLSLTPLYLRTFNLRI